MPLKRPVFPPVSFSRISDRSDKGYSIDIYSNISDNLALVDIFVLTDIDVVDMVFLPLVLLYDLSAFNCFKSESRSE